MKRMALTLFVIGAGAYAAMNPGVVNAFYHDLYPDDPAKQQALELCFMQDHTFNRLDADARDACYGRMLQHLGEASASGQAAMNMVDLQRAAAQGSMPRNDIIRLQENRDTPHPSH